MKRNLILVAIIALSAAMLFTGCDAILEAFYPEFGEGEGGFGENEIIIDVEIDPGFDFAGRGFIKVAIIPIIEIQEAKAFDFDYEGMFTQSFWEPDMVNAHFGPLPARAFRVFIFHDKNEDDVPNFDEASTSARYMDGFQERKLFDFRDGEAKSLPGYAYLSTEHRIDFKFLEKFNVGEDIWDPSFEIWGMDAINKTDPGLFWIDIEPRNDQPVQSITWGVDDLARNPFTFSNASPHTLTGRLDFYVDFRDATPDIASYTSNQVVLWVEVQYATDGGETWYEERRVSVTENDYSFSIEGPDIIDPTATGYYEVKPGGGVAVRNVYWEIFDPWWNLIPIPDTSDKNPPAPYNFDINFGSYDFSTYAHDVMYIGVDIEYGDGTWWYEERELRFFEAGGQAADGSIYDLTVKIKTPWGGAQTYVSIWPDPDTALPLHPIRDVMFPLDPDGSGTQPFSGLSYAPFPYQDWLHIEVDLDKDGWIDFVAERPIWVDIGLAHVELVFNDWEFYWDDYKY